MKRILNLSPIAIKILAKRYLIKDENNNVIETPEEMLHRVAEYVCNGDIELENQVLDIMFDLKFLPNTPTLMNAGITNMLSACFVIPVSDSLESIVHEAGWQQASIHKTGGGVGINLSNLRPKGDLIKTTGGVTSGVMSFLKLFDCLSSVIHQGGKRNGANMGILHISHPEILNFITMKTEDFVNYNNFNLSVMITDKFMKAVQYDDYWDLMFDGKCRDKIKAKDLFEMICESAWKCGCPGILFEDTINRSNPFDSLGMHITTTNPCGEQPLFCGYYNGELIAESCNLGSIDLSKFVNSGPTAHINYEELEYVVRIATRFLDAVINENNYPFEYIDIGTKLTRKIGLGVTGFSDMLVKLGISYDSDNAVRIAEEVMKFIQDMSHYESVKLAKKSGTYVLANLINDNKRNATTTTIAPTGTIGRMMLGHGFSLGIEPPSFLSMKSNIIETTVDEGIHPLLLTILDKIGLFDIAINVLNSGGSIQEIDEIPIDVRRLFLTASEIPIERHIQIQAAFQKYTDNAVSKTVNLPHDATVDDFRRAFMLAYNSGCKGVTIFRDWSKNEQVFVSTSVGDDNVNVDNNLISDNELRTIDDLAPRPKILPALNFEMRTACNTMFINLTKLWEKDGVLESFIDTSGKGGCRAMQDGLAIAISVYQRYIENYIDHKHAVNALNIVTDHLMNVTCQACKVKLKEQSYKDVKNPIDASSCPNALAQIMKFMLNHQVITVIKDKDGNKLDINNIDIRNKINNINNNVDIRDINDNTKLCNDCNIPLIRQEGCNLMQCPNCGAGGCY